MSPETVIDEQVCNFLIPDARARAPVGMFIGPTLLVAKLLCGGLWVGGTATLTEHALIFEPNELNRRHHKGELAMRVPLAEVISVSHHFGLVTGIIRLTTTMGDLKLRCDSATRFAELIDSTRLKSGLLSNPDQTRGA